jgi:DNA-binding MltR family transcriptional regulator
MARDLNEAIDILKEHGLDFAAILRDTNAETMLRLGTLLDEFLELALKGHRVRSGKPVNEKVFQRGGKLEKLGLKITKAKNLGLLDETAFKDAGLLREIRNEFGHLKTKVHFESPEISKWVEQLSTDEEAEHNQAIIFAAMTKVTDQLRASMRQA